MGDANSRFDEKGREKVRCEECFGYFHRLDVHMSTKHKFNLAEYELRHPGCPTMSEWAKHTAELGQLKRREAGGKAPAKAPAPLSEPAAVADTTVEVKPTVYEFGVARLAARSIEAMDDHARGLIPIHDEKWEMGPNETRHLEELALAIQDGENVLIVGPPGCGKTTLVRELAAIIDQPLLRCPFTGEMRLSSLIGMKDLSVDPSTGQTVTSWTDGPLPRAAEKGYWFLADEFDSAPPPVTFVLHPVLEEQRQLTLMDREGGYEVKFHENFRFVATANTLGYGDSSGLYAGTGPMNEALLDRFGTVIRVSYPDPDAEVKILLSKTGVRHDWATSIVEVANKVREAHRNNQTMVSLSPRRLIAWAFKAHRLRNPRRAAVLTVLNKLPDDDHKFIEGIVQRYFGSFAGH